MLTGASRSSWRPVRSLSPDSGSGKEGSSTSMDVGVGSGDAGGMAGGLFPTEGRVGNSVVPKVGASCQDTDFLTSTSEERKKMLAESPKVGVKVPRTDNNGSESLSSKLR